MAKFKSIVTDGGSEALTALIASGQKLILTRAAAGSGVAQVSPNTLTDLVNAENVSASLSEKELVEGSPSIMQIPVQVTNEGLEANVWIREIGVFGLDISGNEILFCYGWLDGEDSDNVLPATTFEEDADTVHIHDLAVFITNQEAAAVSVQVGVGSFVTTAQMTAYAAPVLHTQAATTINETTGETTEQVQRRQDNDIQSILEQLNTGFTGTTVTHTFVSKCSVSLCKAFTNGAILMASGRVPKTSNIFFIMRSDYLRWFIKAICQFSFYFLTPQKSNSNLLSSRGNSTNRV